jgi:DNA-binding MarR family transcriptional regulator
MPILEMPQGSDVLVWLLKGGLQPRPLKDLYGGSRFSEPTIRWVLKALEDDGFIVIERSSIDLRARNVHCTPKLLEAVHEYLGIMRLSPPLEPGP